MASTSDRSLQGDLHLYPFGEHERSEIVKHWYGKLLQEHNSEEILCLTRLCSEQELTESLVSALDTVGYPTVTTLSSFATDCLQSPNPRLTTLSDHERIELLAEFLSNHTWETEYLARAAQHESFPQDVGELLIEMESRDILDPEAYESPILQEIAEIGRDFRELLTSVEYVDRPSLLPQATNALEMAVDNDAVPDAVSQWGVLLVADFEELATTERRFLQAVSEAADAPIVAIAERQSRILSSWREAGTIESMADGLDPVDQQDGDNSQTAPSAVGRYLVTGEEPSGEITSGAARVIEAESFREQLTEVADEIERLCREEEYTYADIAVAYQDSSAPIEKTIRLLRQNGIPTTTVAVSQWGNDPAVRELYDLATYCAEGSETSEAATSRERLLARDNVTEVALSEIQDAATVPDGLWKWVGQTQLKHRIAQDWDEIDVRDQFTRIQEVIDLAEFLTEESRLDTSWSAFLTAMDRAFKYSSTRLENIEKTHEEAGVPVGTIYGLKHSSYRAVFLLNVTDQEYPFTPDLTALLPQLRLQDEPQFPMLTTQTSADVRKTFQPATDSYVDPFHAYFVQVSRRLLGIGACAAAERLYFGVPREGGDSLGTYHQPSRFLNDLVETFGWIKPLADTADATPVSHGGASEFVVEYVDDTLEAVRRASVGGDPVDLDTYERELAAIETLLTAPNAATAQEALGARIDFRHGRVRRD